MSKMSELDIDIQNSTVTSLTRQWWLWFKVELIIQNQRGDRETRTYIRDLIHREFIFEVREYKSL